MPEMMASASARSRPSGVRSAAGPLTFAGIVSIILGRAAAELVDVCWASSFRNATTPSTRRSGIRNSRARRWISISMVAVAQSPSLMSLYPSRRDEDDEVLVSSSA